MAVQSHTGTNDGTCRLCYGTAVEKGGSMKRTRTLEIGVAGLLVMLLHAHVPASEGYPFGILPTNRDYQQVLEYWEAYKDRHLTIRGTTAYAERLWEYQAFAMVFAAYLEEDDTLVSKLWKYVERDVDWDGRLWKGYTAADVLIDIGMALDRAAVRWGGKWDDLAYRWIKQFEYKLSPWNPKCGCSQTQSSDKRNPIHCGAILGDQCGHYMNYYAFSHFFRFDQRTNQTLWMDTVMDCCFYTMEWAYENNELPAWYVRMQDPDSNGVYEGVQVVPGDMWNSSNGDKWDGGATRTAWRVPFAYMAFGNQDALKWSRKMLDFYKSKVSSPEKLSLYRPSDGAKYGGDGHIQVVCGAGVLACAVGDQEWADKVWAYLVEGWKNHDEKINQQKNAQRLYCLLKMSGRFDVFGGAEYDGNTATNSVGRASLRFSRKRNWSMVQMPGHSRSVSARPDRGVYTISGQSVPVNTTPRGNNSVSSLPSSGVYFTNRQDR